MGVEMQHAPTAQIAESNAEQAAEWDGPHGAYWAAHAQQYEESTAGYRRRLVAAVDWLRTVPYSTSGAAPGGSH